MTQGRVRGWTNLRYLRAMTALLDSFERGAERVVVFPLGPRRLALVTEPAAAVAVLRGEPRGLSERGRFYREIARVVGASSLVTVSGEEHVRLRALLAPLFAARRIDGYAPRIAAATRELERDWHDGQTVDVGAAMARLALTIAAETLLGLDIDGEAAEVLEVIDVGTRLFYRVLLPERLSQLLWSQRWLPGNRRLARAQRRLDAVLARRVAERRAETDPSDDMLSALVHSPLDDREIRDQLVTFLFAGHETTAQALTWCWYLLATNADAERALHAELDAAAASDAPRLPYTRAVVREALRLYPPAWFLTRETASATELAGHALAAGLLVFVSPWTLHRDPRSWPEPERFRPERWLDDAPSPEAYLPFGRGRRNCIGASFATVEMVTVLATIAARWRLALADGRPVEPLATITLHPRRPVRVRLVERTQAPPRPSPATPSTSQAASGGVR